MLFDNPYYMRRAPLYYVNTMTAVGPTIPTANTINLCQEMDDEKVKVLVNRMYFDDLIDEGNKMNQRTRVQCPSCNKTVALSSKNGKIAHHLRACAPDADDLTSERCPASSTVYVPTDTPSYKLASALRARQATA